MSHIVDNTVYLSAESQAKILSLNLLAYQFIAPYVISGFVVFMPAILVLALFKQKISRPNIESLWEDERYDKKNR